jgi:probable F420-dependent oxidoreductase
LRAGKPVAAQDEPIPGNPTRERDVKFGAYYWATDYGLPITEVAKVAEASGCESLWVPEHTHMPLGRESARPLSKVGARNELEREYFHMLDPFVALAAAASVTSTIKLGTSICLVPIRDPIITAKAVATLDHVSNGRFLFGVGAGWQSEELADHGVQFTERFARLREHIEAMKMLWTSEEAAYSGDFVRFGPCWCWPKPIQAPHPPILAGLTGSTALRDVVAWADGWMPGPLGPIDERVAELQELARAAGRDPIPVSYVAIEPPDAALVEHLAELGVDRLLFKIRPGELSEVSARIDAALALAP